jgi:hypothetical protein
MGLFRKRNKVNLLLEKCCGLIPLEIQQPGKPLLLFCPRCGRKWQPAELDPKLDETVEYFEVLDTCLEQLFQNSDKMKSLR